MSFRVFSITCASYITLHTLASLSVSRVLIAVVLMFMLNYRIFLSFNLWPLISPQPVSSQPLCVAASSSANDLGLARTGRPPTVPHVDCQRSLAQTSRCLGMHAATVLMTRLRTTYDGGTSVVWRSRALSPSIQAASNDRSWANYHCSALLKRWPFWRVYVHARYCPLFRALDGPCLDFTCDWTYR